MTVTDTGFAFWALFTVTLIGFLVMLTVGDAEGHTEVFDIQAGTADLPYTPGDDPHVAICPSGRFYVPFIDSDGDFVVAWSDDDRDSWDEVVVVSDGWKGETFMMVQSVQSWINNTTVICIRTQDADRQYDFYLFWLWGENEPSDPAAWNYTQINAGGTALGRHLSMIFNRTGMLHIVWFQSNQIRHRTWDVATGEFDMGDTLWKSISGYPMIQCDYNNNVWIGYQSGSWYYIQDWDDTESLQVTTSTSRTQFGAFFIASDNKKIVTGQYQYLSNHAVSIAYETVVNTTMGGNTFQFDTDDWAINYWSTGNVVGTRVSICLLRLEAGSDEYVKYEADYDAVDAVWEGSETVLWTIPTDDDDAGHYGTGPNSIWPKIDGTSVCMPTGGVMYYWMFKDEKGATDDYYDILYSDNATFPTFVWSPPPTITTTSLPDGTIDVFYSFTMSATDGDLPYVWSLILGPAWLEIGSDNGTLYGTPTQTGTFVVKVRVRDNAARTDDATLSLTIESAVSEPGGIDWSVNPDTFIGLLWIIFITLCVCVALIDKIREISTMRRGG